MSNNGPYFGADAMAQFVGLGVIWSCLHKLDLSSNKIDERMIEAFVTGHFPQLPALNLAQCQLSLCTLQLLTSGQWPAMQCLVVGVAEHNAAFFRILQGQQARQLKKGIINVSKWDPIAQGLWPNLQI